LDLITCSILPDWKLKEPEDKNLPKPIIAITKANLSDLVLPRGLWRGPDMSNIYITDSEFTSADLSDVDLSKSILMSSWFKNVSFKKSNLSGCDFRSSVFIDVDLEGADLTNANLEGAIVFPEHLRKVKSLDGCLMFDGTVYDSQKPFDEQVLLK